MHRSPMSFHSMRVCEFAPSCPPNLKITETGALKRTWDYEATTGFIE